MERAYPLLFSARGDEAGGSVTSGSHRSSRSLDLGSITKSVQAISGEIKADQLLITLMGIVMENAGAQKGCIVLDNDDGRGLTVEARKTPSSECVELVNSTPLGESEDLCLALAEAVKRGKKTLALDNASGSGPFRDDPYVRQYGVKSVLCMPILRRNAFRGLLYLENNLSEGVFNAARLAALEIIAAQAAISTEIARLYRITSYNVCYTKLLRVAREPVILANGPQHLPVRVPLAVLRLEISVRGLFFEVMLQNPLRVGGEPQFQQGGHRIGRVPAPHLVVREGAGSYNFV